MEWEEIACLNLVNTYRRDHRGSGASIDRIHLPVWQEAFATHLGAPIPGPAASDDLERLVTLRALLWRVLGAWASERPIPAGDLEELNLALARSPMVRRLEPMRNGHRLSESPTGEGWSGVLASVATSAAGLLAHGEASRLKRCANESCAWWFYDVTRSGTRRWCVGAICGNLVKVRLHRRGSHA
jgi:predicted RNA-binding Zn ribbon-like protein